VRTALAALCIALASLTPVRCEEALDSERKESAILDRRSPARNDKKRRDTTPKIETHETAPKEDPGQAPRAQTLGRDQSGVFVNASAVNSGYSPSFVVRGFPAGVTLFDGASHGFTSQEIDLSTIDHVEFFKGPSAMLFGKALGGYGGAANYLRKTPKPESFAEVVATSGGFDLNRIALDVNTPVNENKSLLFRLTGSAQTVGSFVNFVRSRSFDVAPMLAITTENGDAASLRVEHNGARLVYRDGVPADPIFLRLPREFYAGLPANEHETPIYDDVTFSYDHAFGADWKLTFVADYFLSSSRWGWFTGWGYDGLRALTLGNPVRTRTANRSFDAQLRLNGRFDTGILSHTVFLGLEHWDYFYAYSNLIARGGAAPVNIFAPAYSPGVDYRDAYWSNGFARAVARSVYGQDLIDLNENWRILLGARYDLLAQRERVFDPFGALAGAPTASVSNGTQGYFNPRAGLLFRPDAATQLFFAYGQSLVPNTGVQIRSGEAPPPRRDTQYEIGVRRNFEAHKASFEVSLFDVARDKVAIADPANPNGFYYIVTGQQHSHGLEINIGGEVLPSLTVKAAATFLHAVVSKDDNVPSQKGSDLLGAPRRVYNGGAAYAFNSGDLKGLELGASFNFASRAQATLPNAYGFTLASQRMLGVTLGYRFNENIKIDFAATNLANRQNWTSNGALFHGEPRSFSASLSCKY
jgi:iron complex outermembrane recepter protein